MTGRGGEVGHIFQGGATQGPGVVVRVVMLDFNAMRRCTWRGGEMSGTARDEVESCRRSKY